LDGFERLLQSAGIGVRAVGSNIVGAGKGPERQQRQRSEQEAESAWGKAQGSQDLNNKGTKRRRLKRMVDAAPKLCLVFTGFLFYRPKAEVGGRGLREPKGTKNRIWGISPPARTGKCESWHKNGGQK